MSGDPTDHETWSAVVGTAADQPSTSRSSSASYLVVGVTPEFFDACRAALPSA